MALMLLGALLAIGGLVQTTSSHLTDQSCPDGTSLIAKFSYDHGYSFDSPSGNEHVVTLSHTSASGGDWTSTLAVSAVIVKGGPSAVMTSLIPAQTSGHFSNAGLPKVGEGNTPDISNVQFCGSLTPPSSSTSTSCRCTTSTTSPPTTSTSCRCTTSTTTPPSSTTCECTSTTTTPITEPHVTTTTKEATTTSTSTTTTPPSTVPATTVPGQETTTTTSTTIPVTDTTKVAGTTVVVSPTSTTEHGQGSTTTSGPVVTSTTVLTPTGTKLPFTGGQSGPLLILGILFLASGAALTLSSTRGRRGSRA